MRFVISKTVETKNVSEIAGYFKDGFEIHPAGRNSNASVVKTRRKRRLRRPMKVTAELVKEMQALREEGKIWRVIGRRYGVTGARACQIVTGWGKSRG